MSEINKREEQKEERRNQILEVSLDLFIEKGFSGTKISDISASAGMSAGLFFHYFESKEQVYEELANIGLEGTQAPMMYDFENPLDFFETISEQIFMTIRQNRRVAKMFLFMANAQLDKSAPPKARETALKVNNIQLCIPIIEKGQKTGIIKQGDPEALSLAFWCAIQGIAEYIAVNPDSSCPQGSWVADILRA